MKTETREIYKCDFCRRLYQIKKFAALHEKCCNKNPENQRACLECQHLKKKNFDFYYDTCDGEDYRTISLFHCDKINAFLHLPKNEHKGNVIDTGDDSNIPMRKECDKYKSVASVE